MRGPLLIMTMSPREQSRRVRRVWGAEVVDVESEKKSNCTAYGESAKMEAAWPCGRERLGGRALGGP